MQVYNLLGKIVQGPEDANIIQLNDGNMPR